MRKHIPVLKWHGSTEEKHRTLPKETKDYDKTIKELKKEETELLSKAYDGFMTAFSRESFPMCGMDEMTVTFLVAELARRTGKYEESGRWISKSAHFTQCK